MSTIIRLHCTNFLLAEHQLARALSGFPVHFFSTLLQVFSTFSFIYIMNLYNKAHLRLSFQKPDNSLVCVAYRVDLLVARAKIQQIQQTLPLCDDKVQITFIILQMSDVIVPKVSIQGLPNAAVKFVRSAVLPVLWFY